MDSGTLDVGSEETGKGISRPREYALELAETAEKSEKTGDGEWDTSWECKSIAQRAMRGETRIIR